MGKGKVTVMCSFVIIAMMATVCAENERGNDGVRDALKNRVKDEMLGIALPQEETFVLGTQAEHDEKVLSRQIELITGEESRQYIVGVGDELLISFSDRDEVNTARYKVNDQGCIFLPLVGRLKVTGIPVFKLQEMLNEAMAVYIQKPNVAVVANVTGKIMVVGAVGTPGVYKITSDMTVLEAILTAGSYSKGAEMKSVLLMRGTADKPEIARLNLKQMIKQGNRRDNIVVKPGDMIYVPTSYINNIDAFLSKVYRYVVIWYGLGGQDIIAEGEPFIDAINE